MLSEITGDKVPGYRNIRTLVYVDKMPNYQGQYGVNFHILVVFAVDKHIHDMVIALIGKSRYSSYC